MSKKIFLSIVCTVMLFPSISSAQFALGGGVEIREEDPETGFNLRLENSINLSIPLLAFRWRLQGGAFSSESVDFDGDDITEFTDAESNSYHIGANLLAELKSPIPVNPYGGVGIGYESVNVKFGDIAVDGTQISGFDDSEGSAFVELTLGAKLSVLPLIKPFAEYRYVEPFSDFDGFKNNDISLNGNLTANNRFVFGVLLQF